VGVDSVDLDFFGLRAFLGFVFGEDPWVGGLLLLGDIGADVESELFLFLLFTFLGAPTSWLGTANVGSDCSMKLGWRPERSP